MLLTTLIVIHTIAWAIWFGAGINAPRDIRRCVVMDYPHQDELFGRLKNLMMIWIPAANATLWSGIILALLVYGWAGIPVVIYAKLGLTILTFVIGIGFLKPTLKKLTVALGAKDREKIEKCGLRFSTLIILEKTIILTVILITVIGNV